MKKLAIHTPTQDSYNRVIDKLEKEGRFFNSGRPEETYWETYGENTCINISGEFLSFCDKDWFEHFGFKIMSLDKDEWKPEREEDWRIQESRELEEEFRENDIERVLKQMIRHEKSIKYLKHKIKILKEDLGVIEKKKYYTFYDTLKGWIKK